MVRGLYRIYLYAISVALLIFIAASTGVLLANVFTQNPQLVGQYGIPTSRDDTARSAVFAIVAWAIGGALLGLHYWLIRRDICAEPAAAHGPVRALFLNGTEALSVIVFVISGAGIVSAIGQPYQGNVSGVLATVIVTFALAVIFELERRRARPAPGAALVFQRLHLYSTPLVLLLIIGISSWIQAVQQTIVIVVNNAGLLPNECGPGVSCEYPSPAGQWATAALVSAIWALYWVLARGDTPSALRQVFHLIGLAVGVIITLVGIARGAELGLRALLHFSVGWEDFVNNYSFVPPLVLGAVVLAAYGLRLRADMAGIAGELDRAASRLPAIAVMAGLAAIPFWIGCGGVLHELVETIIGHTSSADTALWASAGSLVIAGLAYPPLAYYLGRVSARTGASGARRGLAYALLAVGTLTSAVGAVIALYTLVSSLLAVPVTDGPTVARSALEALVIGLLMVGLHLRVILSERRRNQPPAPTHTPAPVPTGFPTSAFPTSAL
jgi:hypothetical protein